MFLMTSKGSRSRNCLLEGWTLQGIHVDRVTTHWNTMGMSSGKMSVVVMVASLSLLPFGEATRHHLQPGESPQRRNLAPRVATSVGLREKLCAGPSAVPSMHLTRWLLAGKGHPRSMMTLDLVIP